MRSTRLVWPLVALLTGCGDDLTMASSSTSTDSESSGAGSDSETSEGETGEGETGEGETGEGETGEGETGEGETGEDVCGDGMLDEGEQCDDGDGNGPGNSCTNQCLLNVCGDAEQGPGEGCDDGNGIDDDDCTNACALPSCGDGIVSPGEDCDDQNAIDEDMCLSTCVAAVCGDGVVWLDHETCDAGGTNSDAGMCTLACELAYCGDALVWEGVESCDDGNDDDDDTCTSACTHSPETPTLELSLSSVKRFDFSWTPVVGAEFYQLFHSLDGGQNFSQVGPSEILDVAHTLIVPLHLRLGAQYRLRACNSQSCSDSASIEVAGHLVEAIGYFKASNPDENDSLSIVAISGDGRTLAAGAYREASAATGINGDQSDNSMPYAGAVYVFVRDDAGEWSQQAYIKASNTGANDLFGQQLALSHDGSTLAVGARWESSAATGVNGNQASNAADKAGAVYVFTRSQQGQWSQQAYIKASNTEAADEFGGAISLSDDGDTLAVGAQHEDSSSNVIDSGQNNNAQPSSGAAYVFVRNQQGQWSQDAYIKAPASDDYDSFGVSVALDGNGDALLVGAIYEDGAGVGIGGDIFSNTRINSGAAYLFERNQQAQWEFGTYFKASNPDSDDNFGQGLAISADANTLVVHSSDDSGADGINGDQLDNGSHAAGAVYVFDRAGQGQPWSQQAYIKSSNSEAGDSFGWQLALSDDGDTLVAGASGEDSSAIGIGGVQANNAVGHAGAVYVLRRDAMDSWSQAAYVKAPVSELQDFFGSALALSGDGETLAVGAYGEDGSDAGIGGDVADNSLSMSGAVFVY
jgi:cysteine-rich repeat protein